MLIFGALALAEVPLPLQPECGTPDREDLCPSDAEGDWALWSWVPEAWQDHVRPEEHALGTGVSADRAWRTTTGSTDIVIAVLDSGMLWDDDDLLRKHFLNRGELPVPQDADGVDSTWDHNGDTVFNIDDYADDPRIDPTAGQDVADDLLDPSDLIATFSDGVDDDANGFVDDISGWDFLWNDNDPFDDTDYDHGTYEAREAARETGNEHGGAGSCPNCMVLSVRVGDSFVVDGTNFASGVRFAVDSGADVILEALGTIGHPSAARDAIEHAWDNDVVVVASAADETSYHQNSPGWSERTLYVHAVVPDGDDADESASFLAYSNCTNHGARLMLSTTSTGCSSGATGVTSGVLGLVLSAALDAGVELSAAEQRSLLTMTADDIWIEGMEAADSPYYPSSEGWDRYFGWGRTNAARAVEAVAEGRIPPALSFESPGWFDLLDPVTDGVAEVRVTASARSDYSWSLSYGVGDEPASWTEITSGAATAASDTTVSWDLAAVDIDPSATIAPFGDDADQVSRETTANVFTVTLLLEAEDDNGNRAELRRAVYLHHDPDAVEGWPRRLGASMEASPVLYDLDGDGGMEIVQADADGFVHAFRHDGTQLAGFPVRVEAAEEAEQLGIELHASIAAAPAVGDLDGDGAPDIVAASLRGQVWAWDGSGQVLDGFPVSQGAAPATDPDHLYDEGFFSSPALADLDGDGDLEIVIGGMDQGVYAWEHDGTNAPGWPSFLAYPGYEAHGTRIISSPAVGDVDGDGAVEVVIGTSETLNGHNGSLYVLEANGSVAEGWPVALFGVFTQALPYVGEGVPVSPALADLDGDGDLEIAAFTQAGDYLVFEHDGSERFAADNAADRFGSGSDVGDGSSFPLINNPSFGDLDGDGVPDLVSQGVGSDYAVGLIFDGQRYAHSHTLNAWSGATGAYFPAFPRALEDLGFFHNPAIADVGGDRLPEVLAGTGGFLVHAIDAAGSVPEGWPKFTGHWNMASPAVGDLDGDGLAEVVQVTRAGWLFAWHTPAVLAGGVEWAGFGHDAANTGNHAAPLGEAYDSEPAEDSAGGCGCAGGAAGWWVLGLSLLAVRRR